MSYSGVINESSNRSVVVKLGDLQKSEFLPELGDAVKLKHGETDQEIGVFYIDNVSIADSVIIIHSNDSITTNIVNLEVKLLSRNTTLFDLVFDRFY